MTRRLAVQLLLAAGDYWSKKPASQWTPEDVERLLRDSPWAKAVNADFDTGAEGGPSIGRGGVVGPPAGPLRRRESVRVVWESAQPVRDTKRLVIPRGFEDRYVLSAGEIPVGVMDRRNRPDNPNETAEDKRRRMVDALASSAMLEARGKPPVQPGLVDLAPRTPATWLFGFSRELLEIGRDDREVVFTLKTAFVTLRARFEPKDMIYRGALAV